MARRAATVSRNQFGIPWTGDWIDGVFIRLKIPLPAFPQCFGVESRPLCRIDFSPVCVDIDPRLHRSTEPVDIDCSKSLFREVDAATAFGSLPTTVAPHECRVLLFFIVWKRVVSSDASVSSFKRADLERHVPRDNSVCLPLFDNRDVERFFASVKVLPEVNHILRNVAWFILPEGLGSLCV